MRIFRAILATVALMAAATAAEAACRWDWDCSKGYPCKQVQMCDSASDSPGIKPPSAVELPAIKPPAVSPIPSSPIGPLTQPSIPPVGTTKCQEQRMCDGAGNCRMETVCR